MGKRKFQHPVSVIKRQIREYVQERREEGLSLKDAKQAADSWFVSVGTVNRYYCKGEPRIKPFKRRTIIDWIRY